MKNKLTNLNDHLFAQLERLSDEEIKGKELEEEIERSRAVTSVAKEIINNARIVLDSTIKVGDMIRKTDLPVMLQ